MSETMVLKQPGPASLPSMMLVSILAHALGLVLILVLPGVFPQGKKEPFGGSGGDGGLNVMTIDLGRGLPGKTAAKPVTQEEPAPALYLDKNKEDVVPLESKTSLPDPNQKKKKDVPAAKETQNVPASKRKLDGEFGEGTDKSKNAGKSGTQGSGHGGLSAAGTGGIGAFGSGSGTPFPFPWYVDAVLTTLEIHWAKPFINDSDEHSTLVYFVISKTGQVSKVQVEQSSGIPALDRSVESAVLGSSPFPPLPNQWTEPDLAFRIRFTHTK